MDASEAREHLDMVERIVAASSRKMDVGGEFFIIWGLASAALNLLYQLVADERLPSLALWSIAVIYVFAIGSTYLRVQYYRRCGGRISVLQREFFNVLWLVIAIAFLSDFIAFHLFPNWGGAAIWSVAAAIVLFYIGIHGNRRATIGGAVMLASIAVANFELPVAGYWLAGGMLLGYAGFGLADMLASD